jgi:hypothetical protein
MKRIMQIIPYVLILISACVPAAPIETIIPVNPTQSTSMEIAATIERSATPTLNPSTMKSPTFQPLLSSTPFILLETVNPQYYQDSYLQASITSIFTPSPLQIAIDDICQNPENYLGAKVKFNGEVSKVEQVSKEGITYTRVQLSDPIPSGTKCLKNDMNLPVLIYYNTSENIDLSEAVLGSVVVVEGIGNGVLTGETNTGVTVTVAKVIGTLLSKDTTCVVTLTVRTSPPGIFLYLDGMKRSISSPEAIFYNVCPGIHTLSAMSILGVLIDKQPVGVPPNVATVRATYVHNTNNAYSGGTTSYYNWPWP